MARLAIAVLSATVAVVAAVGRSSTSASSICPSVELTVKDKCYTYSVGELPPTVTTLIGGQFRFLVSGPCYAAKTPECTNMDGDTGPSPILDPDGQPGEGHCVSCGSLSAATVAPLVRACARGTTYMLP